MRLSRLLHPSSSSTRCGRLLSVFVISTLLAFATPAAVVPKVGVKFRDFTQEHADFGHGGANALQLGCVDKYLNKMGKPTLVTACTKAAHDANGTVSVFTTQFNFNQWYGRDGGGSVCVCVWVCVCV